MLENRDRLFLEPMKPIKMMEQETNKGVMNKPLKYILKTSIIKPLLIKSVDEGEYNDTLSTNYENIQN
jgi:hypothetical protein